jgi:hypothetical protein
LMTTHHAGKIWIRVLPPAKSATWDDTLHLSLKYRQLVRSGRRKRYNEFKKPLPLMGRGFFLL